jgi:dolichol-phosphate mannosyltransferase
MTLMTLMKDNVCILIPTLNEAQTIANVVGKFKALGFNDILVIDGNSTDGTREAASRAGAKVVVQRGRGKGLALQQAFEMIEKEVVVLIDGDGTYEPNDVERLLAPIHRGEVDHVIGNRFANYEAGAFTRLNLFGNKMLNKIFGIGYGVWLNDILSGYRAITKKCLRELELNKMGFEVEAELTAETVKKNFNIVEVPITYYARAKGATKLNPLRDGLKIALTIYGLARMYNPIFYFGLLGAIFVLSGTAVGIYVVSEWLKGITRIPMTILSTLLIILGFQMFVFAFLSDLYVKLHRELIREIKKLK